MLGRLNHVAIAVRDLRSAIRLYQETLGARVSDPAALPDHGVTSAFVELENTTIELLEPLGDESPISGFLERNPSGGIHHICVEVEDIETARGRIEKSNARVLGPEKPRIGAHGNPVLFLHPKDFLGTLIELEQAEESGFER